jgi:hypothetical protein
MRPVIHIVSVVFVLFVLIGGAAAQITCWQMDRMTTCYTPRGPFTQTEISKGSGVISDPSGRTESYLILPSPFRRDDREPQFDDVLDEWRRWQNRYDSTPYSRQPDPLTVPSWDR